MAVTMNYGAAPTYVKIASQTLTSAATVTFSNIPQGYTDLRLIVVGGTTRATTSDTIRFQFNSDTTSTYSSNFVTGNGSAASAALYATQTLLFTDGIRLVGTDFGLRSMIAYDIMNYANTTTYKTTLARCVTPESTVIGSSVAVGLWRSTSAITSIYLQGDSVANFAIGSTFTLYGIKAALVPKATGGDIVVQNGSYWYHAFRTTGSFQPKQSLSCDVLVVAGGGAGGGNGSNGGGGGGAGGIFYATSQTLSTAQTVTVGAGGASSPPTTSLAGPSGSNSTFGSLTAGVGGGGGGFGAASGAGQSGVNGGSGGGSGGSPGGLATGGSSTQTGTGGTGYGFAGGTSNSNWASAGGGGAGAVGASATSTDSAATGGAGLNTWSSWLYATGTGVSGYIAGGGGGGYTSSSAGGSGGGGAGGAYNSTVAVSGVANTGSGGGGSTGAYNYNISGAGGSGIIIVRYPI